MIFAYEHCGTATMLGKTEKRGDPSGLFLFEEAAERVDWIGRILLRLLRRSLGLRTSTEAAQLRLQHARGNAADVGNKFRILGCAFDLKWNGRAAATRILAIA